jgi:hypothetical protein
MVLYWDMMGDGTVPFDGSARSVLVQGQMGPTILSLQNLHIIPGTTCTMLDERYPVGANKVQCNLQVIALTMLTIDGTDINGIILEHDGTVPFDGSAGPVLFQGQAGPNIRSLLNFAQLYYR